VVELRQWAKAHFFIGISMNRTDIVAKIQEIAERVAQPEGLEIVEIELKGAGRHQVLLIVIDKPDGVTHGDCELVSHQVGTILDAEDTIHGTYSLEVSSPGVERKLRNWKDWVRFVGEKAKVVLREPVAVAAAPAPSKHFEPLRHFEPLKHFEGVIARADDRGRTVTVELSGGAEVTFPVEQVDRANLKFEW
jgi:ribosome maturation factor RimP